MKKLCKIVAALGSLLALTVWPAQAKASICYTVCVQGRWQPEVCDGVMAGTTGQGLPIQALRIRDTSGATIAYRAHLSYFGWQESHSGNAYPGDQGLGTCGSTRVEAIEAFEAMGSSSIAYWGHVQNLGDQMWRYDGAMQGTTGRSLQLEAIKMKTIPRPFTCLDTSWSWPGSYFLNVSMLKTGENSDGSPICTITGNVRLNVEGPATNFTVYEVTPTIDDVAHNYRVDLDTNIGDRIVLEFDDYDNPWEAYYEIQGAILPTAKNYAVFPAANAQRDWNCL